MVVPLATFLAWISATFDSTGACIVEEIDQLEFDRFLAPGLADSRGPLTTFLGGAINGMEDCDASKIRMANQATVIVEVGKGGIDNDLEIPRECLYDPNPCRRISGSSAHCRLTIFAMVSADAASSASGHHARADGP